MASGLYTRPTVSARAERDAVIPMALLIPHTTISPLCSAGELPLKIVRLHTRDALEHGNLALAEAAALQPLFLTCYFVLRFLERPPPMP
jgi:hypothetical protein